LEKYFNSLLIEIQFFKKKKQTSLINVYKGNKKK
jgi:hypothetical protein